jgi:hypothetical protein
MGKRESSEELHKNDLAAKSLAPAKKKAKLLHGVPSGKNEKEIGNGKLVKSIQDLVQLSVAKEELRGKKKKREKLKNKQKFRKVNPTDGVQTPGHGNGDHVKRSTAMTCKAATNISHTSTDNEPKDMSGNDKAKMLERKQQAKVKKFGSWFPSAFTVKGSTPVVADTISIVLFYQYVEPPWSEDRKQQVINVDRRCECGVLFESPDKCFVSYHSSLLTRYPLQVLQFTIDKGAELGLGGRARIAREGVNCTISGTQVRPALLHEGERERETDRRARRLQNLSRRSKCGEWLAMQHRSRRRHNSAQGGTKRKRGRARRMLAACLLLLLAAAAAQLLAAVQLSWTAA